MPKITLAPGTDTTAQRVGRANPRRGRRTTYVAESELRCALCSTSIPAGERHYRGPARTTMHPVCARLRIKPEVKEPRVIVGSPIPAPAIPVCPWCAEPVPGPPKVTLDSKVWHHDCYLAQHRPGWPVSRR